MKMFRLIFAGIVALVVSLSGGTAVAASSCKGLSKSACGRNAACSWVNSYTTKKGATVEGYCRAKPSKGAASKGSARKAGKEKVSRGSKDKAGALNSKAAKEKRSASDKASKSKKDKKKADKSKEKKKANKSDKKEKK